MTFRNRIVRLGAALVLAGFVAAQIPLRGAGTALAQGGYPIDDKGDFLKTLTQAGGLALIAYGISATAKGGAAAQGPLGANGNKPIYDVLAANADDFSEAKRLVDAAELRTTLRSEGPYTFFAPNNAALSKLSPEEAASLANPGNQSKLATLLKYHIVQGRYTIADLKKMPEGQALTTLSGDSILVTNAGGLKVNDVPVVETDIPANNGWIHPIQGTLTPPDAKDDAAKESSVTQPASNNETPAPGAAEEGSNTH